MENTCNVSDPCPRCNEADLERHGNKDVCPKCVMIIGLAASLEPLAEPGRQPAILSTVKELDQAAAAIVDHLRAKHSCTASCILHLELCLSELLHAGIIEIGPKYHDMSSLSQAKPQ